MDAQLIGSNPKEEALIKIRDLQKHNATAVQRQQIMNLESNMYKLFLKLVSKGYGIDHKQLLDFSDDQIEGLGEVIYHRSKTNAIIGGGLVWIIGLVVPFVGWFVILPESNKGDIGATLSVSYSYRRLYRRLRLADNKFSAKRLRESDL